MHNNNSRHRPLKTVFICSGKVIHNFVVEVEGVNCRFQVMIAPVIVSPYLKQPKPLLTLTLGLYTMLYTIVDSVFKWLR